MRCEFYTGWYWVLPIFPSFRNIGGRPLPAIIYGWAVRWGTPDAWPRPSLKTPYKTQDCTFRTSLIFASWNNSSTWTCNSNKWPLSWSPLRPTSWSTRWILSPIGTAWWRSWREAWVPSSWGLSLQSYLISYHGIIIHVLSIYQLSRDNQSILTMALRHVRHGILRVGVFVCIEIVSADARLRSHVRILAWVWWELVQRNSWLRSDVFGSVWSEPSAWNWFRLFPHDVNVVYAGLLASFCRIVSRRMLFILSHIFVVVGCEALVEVDHALLGFLFLILKCYGLMTEQRAISIGNQ